MNELERKIFEINDDNQFESVALEVFQFQYQNNLVYQQFCDLTSKQNPSSIDEIPYLPIGFFKTQKVTCGDFEPEITFTSSGTTGQNTSKHLVKDLHLYQKSFREFFSQKYPNWPQRAIIGLLPSYLEREGSSLIYMVDDLIKNNVHPKSGFYLKSEQDLIRFLQEDPSPKILFGVTFALLELADKNISLNNTTIIETGGMKGRGKELIRPELHRILNEKLSPTAIHSEYGMTELLSQAYLQKHQFECPPWMKILIREPSDPFTLKAVGRGAINVIDLANLYSCSFIATDDLGKLENNGNFEVLGRIDHSQIRGCNLLVL